MDLNKFKNIKFPAWLKGLNGQPLISDKKKALADYQNTTEAEKARRTNGGIVPSHIAETGDGSPALEKNSESVGGPVKSVETSLIAGEIISFYDWRRAGTILGYYLGIGFFIIGVAYGGLVLYEKIKKERIEAINEEFIQLVKNIASLKRDVADVVNINKKINGAKMLLDQHVYWTNLFRFLEDRTLSEVRYKDFSGETKGEYTLSSDAKNYYVVAEQIRAFRSSPYTLSAVTKGGRSSTGAGGEEDGTVSFELEIKIDPKIFRNYEPAEAINK